MTLELHYSLHMHVVLKLITVSEMAVLCVPEESGI